MPRLWSDTVDTHRQEVRYAIIETTASLVASGGVRSVTMSRIAEDVGIGRATLYKYFPDVESILQAWHEEHIDAHLGQLRELAHGEGSVDERLTAVLQAYALVRFQIAHQGHGADLTALFHQHGGVAGTEEHVREFLQRLMIEGVAAGFVRSDVSPGELATFCVFALSGAGSLPSKAAVSRLVMVVLEGLRGSDSS
ncbi:MAG: TetR/AcrR family transcriptional regulator [Acidimicrobiales bacterium]|nr:TetR/AcrR family transcriptional regulator [Acidimicrobiales bacterium]